MKQADKLAEALDKVRKLLVVGKQGFGMPYQRAIGVAEQALAEYEQSKQQPSGDRKKALEWITETIQQESEQDCLDILETIRQALQQPDIEADLIDRCVKAEARAKDLNILLKTFVPNPEGNGTQTTFDLGAEHLSDEEKIVTFKDPPNINRTYIINKALACVGVHSDDVIAEERPARLKVPKDFYICYACFQASDGDATECEHCGNVFNKGEE